MSYRSWLLGTALLGSAACAQPAPAPQSAAAAQPPNASVKPSTLDAMAAVAAPQPPREEPPSVEQLRAIRDSLGGAALLAELKRLPSDPERAFSFQKRVFDLVRDFGDPGAADALAAYLAEKQHPYFETRAAQALAALNDLRAVPYLARRLRLNPLEVYGEADWELRLKRDDNERVTSARLLADLAKLHPEARAVSAEQAEDAIWFWLQEMPSPHANGLRALAALRTTKHLQELRDWSNPQVALPLEGQQPPMPEEWVIAQSALRQIGAMRDAASFPVLLSMLERRPKDRDVTMNGLTSGGIAILGMSLRAIGIGAADGLSEWRDARAFQPLLSYVNDPLNNENSRLSAGAALGWVGTDKDLEQLAKLAASGGVSPTAVFQRICYLEGLRARPSRGVPGLLLPLLARKQPAELRGAAARAIGRSRLDSAVEAKLTALLKSPELRNDAALALLLGGSSKAAIDAIQSYATKQGPSLEELGDAWYQALSSSVLSTDDVSDGTLFRHVENAEAVAALSFNKRPQGWALAMLGKTLEVIVYDNGPHSVTRVVLSDQLRRLARGTDARQAQLALRTLGLLHATGDLLDTSRGTGPTADAARLLYRSILAADASKPPVELFD